MNDIWCLGVALYVMIECRLPFDRKSKEQTEKNIINLNWL
jgi:serine/threonine protein kinase